MPTITITNGVRTLKLTKQERAAVTLARSVHADLERDMSDIFDDEMDTQQELTAILQTAEPPVVRKNPVKQPA